MMNDRSVKPIGNMHSVESRVYASDQVEHAKLREHSVPDMKKSAEPTQYDRAEANQAANISIHFNVDEQTNRLVVVVSERESGRVIRTIPASEFEKMRAGDLLKIRA